MKGTFVAAMAALAGVSAGHNHRQAHNLFKKNALVTGTGETCVPTCTTIWTTITGDMTLVPPTTTVEPTTTVTATSTKTETHTVTATPSTSSAPQPTSTTEVIVVPTPHPHTCPTPGTYTIPATTITVSQTTTVCAATSTQVPPGTHTVGGVTTVVETSTVVTCPVATVSTSGTVTHSTILMTTYVCPSAGTYTINPHTTTVTESTIVVYPTPTSYNPGTYTAPEKVVTVTETGYVTYCPFTSSGLPTPTPEPKPTSEPKPSSKPQPKPSQSPKPNPGSVGGSGDHYGITYTPYTSDSGDCKTADAVDKDIAEIKKAGFQVVRVYSTDCNTFETVIPACKKYGLEVIIGVFVKDTCSYNAPDVKEQVDTIAKWADWSMVKLIIIGNEAIMQGHCSPGQLVELIKVVKSKCSGYNGPYTIAETLNIWQRKDVSSTVCPHIDITAANIHAFFNPNTKAEDAGKFVKGQMEILKGICGQKVINVETGWPKEGSANGVAVPSPENQIAALNSIRKETGSDSIFFSLHDDLWKAGGEFNCEKSWGVSAAFSLN